MKLHCNFCLRYRQLQVKYVDVYVKWNTTLAYKILTQMDCLTLNYKA